MEATVQQKAAGLSADEIERLFLEHYSLLYKAAKKVTKHKQDAEDVVQILFLKFHQYQFPPDIRSNPKGYLHRAVVNEARDFLRSRGRHEGDDGFAFDQIPARGIGRVYDNVKSKLEEIFASLRPNTKEIVLLHYQDGYSDAEIADMLGQSCGKVAMVLNRARKRLEELTD